MMRATVFNRAIILDAEQLLHSAVDDINAIAKKLANDTWKGGNVEAARLLLNINQRLLTASSYLLYSDGYDGTAEAPWLTAIH